MFETNHIALSFTITIDEERINGVKVKGGHGKCADGSNGDGSDGFVFSHIDMSGLAVCESSK